MQAKLYLAGLVMSAFTSAAMAADTVDGRINFTGSVVSDSCKISSATGDARNINVDMGAVSADDIGTVAAPKFLANGYGTASFTVSCKQDSKVTMQFAGPATELSADKKTIRVNSGALGAGLAQGVSIAVYEGTGAGAKAFDLSNGNLLQQDMAAGSTIGVEFAAAYVANDPAKIVPGKANASLPFKLIYQ
ncbi:fimbrial protein [Burkholderia territorii]|uniref:fimbrial protein n=1 Tax=Burkholderia territorii TaxID=1503055 RepID=UPI00075A5161|nr:fimbrial protein [Burkholderia territorii]KVL25526.1 fimbrial protein [Burkholderia territorii]KVL32597.1 fimbrial protein [Burkholderia territorii]KVL43315.1 fimbrial protein [Burkholderia territorii]KVQ50286.1 fimbrial protein [Burkholderia territorii]KVQ58061.1 fimbrial protein [Burkholderia territorii]